MMWSVVTVQQGTRHAMVAGSGGDNGAIFEDKSPLKFSSGVSLWKVVHSVVTECTDPITFHFLCRSTE